MFARLVEFAPICDAALEFMLVVEQKALPIVAAQPGCIDAFVLVSETDRHIVLGISLWESAADAERYHREVYTDIEEMLRPLLKHKPTVCTFQVLSSKHLRLTPLTGSGRSVDRIGPSRPPQH